MITCHLPYASKDVNGYKEFMEHNPVYFTTGFRDDPHLPDVIDSAHAPLTIIAGNP
jgi:hypothetical protein